MDKLLHGLKTRYDAVFDARSDSEFYQNIHGYIDFIVKTPVLLKIIEKAEEDYHRKHYNLWHPRTEDEKENELRSEQTHKLERFNLYSAHYITLYVKIYFPLEDYKTTDESDVDQDPVALIMLKGLKNLLRRGYHKDPKNYFKWSKENLKSYSRNYEGMRDFYESELRQLHLQLVSEVEKIKDMPEDTKSSGDGVNIFIDESKGIYKILKDKEIYYPIGRGSKRFSIVKHLAIQKLAKLSQLEKLTEQRPEVIMQEIGRINKAFRNKLKLTDNLIIRHNTGGYSLNDIFKYSLDFSS